MTQYKTQYGTIFAVKEHNGAPAIMRRAELSETWSLSSMITPFTPGAWTAEELQGQLDSWAATKGWQPVAEPASAEPPLPMPGDVYQAPQSGQLYKIGELTNGKKTCYLTMRCNVQDGTWVPANSSVYPNLSDAQGEFEAWIRREQLEPVAQTMDAAVITDERAAKEPSKAEETSTTSAIGADAGTSLPGSSCKGAPNSSPAPAFPADAGAAEQSLPAAGPAPQAPAALPLSAPDTAPTSLPAFDFGALDAETAEKLRGITDCVMELYQTYAWGMAYQVGRAHDLLCGDSDRCETVSQRSENGQFAKKEKTFTAWCVYIGVERRSAYNLLNAYRLICKATPEQQRNLQLAPAKLLYEAGKKDVPGQLADAVMNGDITKTKQFLEAKREWQDKLDAEHAAREQAEQQRDEAVTHIKAARDMQIDTARERDAALRRATEAEKQRDGARDALQAAKLRGDKLKAENDALKAQPVEAKVIDEEEVDRRAKARAAELTAPLREELEALRNRHPADLEAAEQAIRDAYDSAIYTGRVMENAWHTLRPLLPCMDAERRDLAIRQLSKTIATIQGEIAACL